MKSKIILGLVISLSILSACDNSDDFDVRFDAVGDVYVRCQKIENEIKYATVYYAYSNTYMSEAKVAFSDEDSPVITLSKLGENTTIFTSTPSIEDYSTDNINNGDYEFNLISSESDTLNVKDELLVDRIDPIEITKFEYDADNHEIDIAWDVVNNSDIYRISIATKIDGREVYRAFTKEEVKLVKTNNYSEWDGSYEMKEGTTYTVSVSAYKFEDSDNESLFHINQESVEYQEITWGNNYVYNL